METNKIQWKKIAKGEELPCQSFLRKKDGEILNLSTVGGVKVGQDCYYLPVDEVINVIKDYPIEESEGERMIQYFKDLAPFDKAEELYEKYGFSHKDAIAWLEKQGEQKPQGKSALEAAKEEKIDNANKVEPKFNERDWVVISTTKGDRVVQIASVEYSKDGYPSYITTESRWFGNGTKARLLTDKDVETITLPESKVIVEAKVEPEFHEGDWIIHHGTENIYQVVAIIDNQYQLKYGDNYTIQKCADVDRCARLWNIAKDAKDGDVLATKDAVFIFKHIDKTGLSLCKSYCEVIGNSNLGFGFDFSINSICPATKEQRDTLMKAMTDAGYTFDFEKKELKKIEQKPADRGCNIKEEDMTPFQKYVFGIIDLGVEQDRGLKQVCDELLYLAAKEIKQNPVEWSEEDKDLLYETLSNLTEIKDRYGEGYGRVGECLNWLKSLRPQSTWKPSDNELEVLRLAAEKDGTCLMGLYEKLKKLKE